MKNTSVTLGDHFDHFVAEALANGRYRAVSEIIREGLSLLEVRETKLKELRAALFQGELSGSTQFSLESLIEEFVARHSS